MLCSDLNEKDILKRGDICIHIVDFLVVQTVNNLPAMKETWVRSWSWEDPLEKGKTTQSSILTWRIPWTEKPGGLQSMGSQWVRYDLATNTLTFIDLISKAKTIKFLKENIEYLHRLETGKGFLERRQKVIIIKRKYDDVDFIKIYDSWSSKT